MSWKLHIYNQKLPQNIPLLQIKSNLLSQKYLQYILTSKEKSLDSTEAWLLLIIVTLYFPINSQISLRSQTIPSEILPENAKPTRLTFYLLNTLPHLFYTIFVLDISHTAVTLLQQSE